MNIKTIILFLFFTVSALAVIGQSEQGVYEVILCKDGSILKGHIVSEDENQILFDLYRMDKSIYVGKEQITQIYDLSNYYMYPKGRSHKRLGFTTSISVQGGSETGQLQLLRYKIKPKYGVGFGLGINEMGTAGGHLSFGEAFLYGKYFINNNRRRLFVDAKVGYALPMDRSIWTYHTGAPKFQTSIGVDFARSKKGNYSIFIGHLIQRTRIKKHVTWVDNADIIYKILLNRTTIGVSWNF